MGYIFGDYELDEQLYELRRAGEPVEIERKVYDVLAYLVLHHDRLVPKEELLDTLWPGQVVGEAALTRCITAARKVLGDDGNRQEFIKTQYGRGYRFAAPLTISPPIVSRQQEAVESPDGEDGSQAEARREDGALIDDSTPVRFWSRTRVALSFGVLLVGTLLSVLYLSRPPLNTQLLTLSPQETQPPALPLPDKPSIAVLPFTNLSEDPEQDYFSDGVTEEITSALSRISSLFVIARTSAFTYKGNPIKVQHLPQLRWNEPSPSIPIMLMPTLT